MVRPISVLFTHYGEDWIRGSEVVLLDLLAALDKEKVRPVVWCNTAEMERASQAHGHLTYRDDFEHMWDYSSPRADFAGWRRTVKKCVALCRQHQIDVLHSNSLAPTQWLAPAGVELRRPVLSHLHIDYLRRSRYVLGLHAVTMIVGCSESTVSGALADGVRPGQVRVIYNGIDFARLGSPDRSLRTELGIPADSLVVASVGSLIRRKGHDILLSAFHALPATSTGPHLIIAGSGEEEGALRRQTRSLGIAHRVHFIGDTKGDGRIYKAADLFALASRNEAIPLTLMEAGFFGLPIVATTAGGIPEAVMDGRTGLLAPPDDVGKFAAALKQIASDVGLRQRLGAAARRHVAARFTAARMAREMEQAYGELAAIPDSALGWQRTLRDSAMPYFKLARLLVRKTYRRARPVGDDPACPALPEAIGERRARAR